MNTFISTTETAKILGVSRVAVFNRIKSGQLKAIKVGRNYIISKNDILHTKNKKVLTDIKNVEIEKGVERVIHEYGKTLKLLEHS